MAYKMKKNAMLFFLICFFLICCRTDKRSISEKEFDDSNENYNENLCSFELQQVLDNKVKELDFPGIQASVRVNDFY
jgi:hypothetical protein